MNSNSVEELGIVPEIQPRACGGWIATTARGAALSFGVTANSEAEVRERFETSLRRWIEIINGEAAN
ncbi:hypothetical protein [Bradyrhizobium elkanii]|uniref:hypothetical protein n=1 Tax=Bradyrhizobium elkanii TaxID=29448 RepID=UPI003D1AAE18